jgi:hypothetical protein
VHTPVTEVCAITAVVWLRLVDDVRSTASDVDILAIALIGMCALILSPRTEREIDAQPRHTPGRQQRALAAAAGRCCESLACMSIDIDKLSETELVASADLDIAFSRVLRNARRAPDMDARHANQSRKSRIRRERVRTCAGLAIRETHRKCVSQQAARSGAAFHRPSSRRVLFENINTAALEYDPAVSVGLPELCLTRLD